MTELMEKYEKEADDLQPRDCCTTHLLGWYERFSKWLGAQLTWQPVSEKLPSVEKDGNAVIARLKDLDEGLVQSDVVSTVWFIDKYESWYTHWLPIPPAPEGEVK